MSSLRFRNQNILYDCFPFSKLGKRGSLSADAVLDDSFKKQMGFPPPKGNLWILKLVKCLMQICGKIIWTLPRMQYVCAVSSLKFNIQAFKSPVFVIKWK